MHFDLTTFLTIVLEGLLFVYYADTVFSPRKRKLYSNLISIGGYCALLLVACLFNPTLNVTFFVIVNFVVIYIGFQVSLKSAVVHTLALTVFMMLADFFMAFIIDYQIKDMSLLTLSRQETFIQLIGSKCIYLISIIILKSVVKNRDLYDKGNSGRIGLMIMPVFSITFMFVIMQIMPVLDPFQKNMLVLLGLFATVSNIVVFWIYDNALLQSAKLHALQDLAHQNEMDLELYKRVKQKYDQTRIMRHDMLEHLGVLETLIQENTEEAIDYLHTMVPPALDSNLCDISSSKIFNALIAQKTKICKENGIHFDIIHHNTVDMGFISDIDIVSIFSNLLNNAIESSRNSQKKYIAMEFFRRNSFFLVTLKNSADRQPVYEGKSLLTHKKNKSIHGIGMRSINDAVQKYDGYIDWNYDDQEHSFEIVLGLRAANNVCQTAPKDVPAF